MMFALAAWMLWQTGPASLSLQLSPPAATMAATVGVMANAAMLIVADFAALLLNFGDFARFGKDEAATKMGDFPTGAVACPTLGGATRAFRTCTTRTRPERRKLWRSAPCA